jgi:hypothetical protein
MVRDQARHGRGGEKRRRRQPKAQTLAPLAAQGCTSQGRGIGYDFRRESRETRPRVYEAALFSTPMQQESATAAELGDEFDFDVTLRETLVRMVSNELQKGGE